MTRTHITVALRLQLHRAGLLRVDEHLVVYEEFVPLQMHPRLRLISLDLMQKIFLKIEC